MPSIQKAVTGVIVLFILSIPFIAYQAFVSIPREKIEAQQAQAAAAIQAKEIEKKKMIAEYDQCISSAWETYSENWDQACKVSKLENDCILENYLSTGLNNRHEQAKDRCVSLYK